MPVTIGPGCGRPPLPGPGETSGGWAPVESDWYQDPSPYGYSEQDPYGQGWAYAADWPDQGGTQSVCPCCGRSDADAPGSSTQDDDLTGDWYGNPGY